MSSLRAIAVFLVCQAVYAQIPNILNQQMGYFDSKPYLTPTSSPATSINLNWNTEKQESTIVAYGQTPALNDTQKLPGLRNYHHIMLHGLMPATEYFYQVAPHGSVNKFKTFPLYVDSFSFIVFGDTRSDSIKHLAVVNSMLSRDFEFYINTGDLTNRGYHTGDWRTFFNIEDTILCQNLFMPVLGNHEKPFWPYDTLFALPGAEYFYSLDYGNVHLVFLNTENDLYGVQRNWLINDLQMAKLDTVIDWIIVSLHRPPYSSGSHGSQADVRRAWCPIFENFDVDIVYGGHDHSYQRTDPINGVVYIVTAGGGAPLYDVGSSSWTAYSERTFHFCHVDITGRQLKHTAIKPDGTVFDSLVLSK